MMLYVCCVWQQQNRIMCFLYAFISITIIANIYNKSIFNEINLAFNAAYSFISRNLILITCLFGAFINILSGLPIRPLFPTI